MTIEFIGIAHTRPGSESEAVDASAPLVQPDYLKAIARAHEDSGFDRVLVAHSSASPDGFTVADQILTHTERIGVLLAHRPGFVAPTYAARKYATLDAFHPGRIALHTITGGDDKDQARDGDLSDKPSRYRRSDEFLSIVRKEWESAQPFDFEGEFYTVKGGWSAVRPAPGAIPIYFGGASEDAVRVGGKQADVYAFWVSRWPGSPSGSSRCARPPRPTGATRASASACGPSRPRPRRRPGSARRTSSN